ncbi:hypothetical protein V2G26_016636 [Clonostachys chloroleuca]
MLAIDQHALCPSNDAEFHKHGSAALGSLIKSCPSYTCCLGRQHMIFMYVILESSSYWLALASNQQRAE